MSLTDILIAVAVGLLADEVLGWTGWVTDRLIRRSAKQAPQVLRKRLQEEWLAHAAQLPSRVSRLIFALDCRRASFVICHDHSLPNVSVWVAVRMRSLDLLFSVTGLMYAWPVLLLAIVAIKLEDGWRAPVFATEICVGQGGREIELQRLRCTRNAINGSQAESRLPGGTRRLTRVGRLLTWTCFSELPLFFNLLRGDISVVGPSPQSPELSARLSQVMPLYTERQKVKPGLTGLAQLCSPWSRSLRDRIQRLSYDLYFVEHQFGVRSSLAIIWRTTKVILSEDLSPSKGKRVESHAVVNASGKLMNGVAILAWKRG